MKTYVITGGTDGIGKALADRYLERGQEVVVIGRSAEKGEAWLAAAQHRGAAARAHFIRADLSRLSETRAVVERIRSAWAQVDADLLGVAFVDTRPTTTVRYVLFNPGTVNTGFSGQYTPDVMTQIDIIRRSAQPVHEAIVPILKLLDDPPLAPLSAFVRDKPLSAQGPGFTLAEARRLHRYTTGLLAD
ncbi:SDR family oxidoreductase [Streptomyces sp. BHT-5-2]|uniref:SDR family NAD(P)-dependent oxidoreductase n=1 Tax=Streptomyces sp. BHT-5-2 TaxID=2866715 RepID=UPI001C8DB895|nr:SDR family NAD(P)-dependent oxidoreductase [Streptomyces sp. BHT-5-2]QZL04865.1 SDR family oxidoreductase [Streptomyces sp. BHT-5-2]